MQEINNRNELERKADGNLFIGCGGTGFEVVRRLKRQLLEDVKDESILKSVGFLVFDAEPFDLRPRDPIENSEYIDLSNGRLITSSLIGKDSTLRQGRDLLKDWWYENWTNPPVIKDGAGQRPPLGRLAFYAMAGSIAAKITEKINDINNFIVRIKATREVRPQYLINAHIISSLAGGTGRGIFLDIGILTNYLLTRDGGISAPDVFAYLLNGRIFSKLGAQRAVLNTAASFYELFYFYEGKAREVVYPIENTLSLTIGVQNQTGAINPIFKRIIFFDDINSKGLAANNPDIIYEIMSHTLFPLTLDVAGGHLTSDVVNNFTPVDIDHLISSMGCRVVKFPEREIENYFFMRSATKILNDFFLQNPDEGYKKQSVTNAIAALKIDEEGLQRNQIQDRLLQKEDSTNNYGLSISFDDYKQMLPNYSNSDIAVLESFIDDNNKRIKGLRVSMENRVEDILKETSNDLNRIVEAEFDNKGIVAALSLLHGIKDKMDSFINQLSEEKEDLEKSMENVIENLKQELEGYVNRFLGASKWRNYFRHVGMIEFNDYYKNRLEIEKREVAIKFINDFKEKLLKNLIKKYEDLKRDLESYYQNINARLNNWKTHYNANFLGNPVIDKFLSAEEIEKLYELTVDENLNSTSTEKKFTLNPVLNSIIRDLKKAQGMKDVDSIFREQILDFFSDWIRNNLDFFNSLQILYPGKSNELSDEAKTKIEETFTRMIDGLALWWNIDTARAMVDKYNFAFVGPQDTTAGSTSNQISSKWLNLIQDVLSTLTTTLKARVSTYGIPQKPERYFVALLACSSVKINSLIGFNTYTNALEKYIEDIYIKQLPYNTCPPVFIDRRIESYAASRIMTEEESSIPSFVVKAVGYGILRSIGYGQNWLIAFSEKPRNILENTKYSLDLKSKEDFMKGVEKESIEETLKELEGVNYIYTFPFRYRSEDLREAINYMSKVEALKSDVIKEIEILEIKFERIKDQDPYFKEETIKKTMRRIDELKKLVMEGEDVEAKKFWLKLENELKALFEKG